MWNFLLFVFLFVLLVVRFVMFEVLGIRSLVLSIFIVEFILYVFFVLIVGVQFFFFGL